MSLHLTLPNRKNILGHISMPSGSFFRIWVVNSKIFYWLSIMSVSRSFRWPYAPTNSIDFIPVAKKGILFDLRMNESVAKSLLGLLDLQGEPSSKSSNSCHAISSLDQWKSFKNATSASSRPVQAYFRCVGLVKHFKICCKKIKKNCCSWKIAVVVFPAHCSYLKFYQ